MSEKNHKILNLIDSIKTKITDQEYIDIVNQINDEEKKNSDEENKYLITGFYTYLRDDDRESISGNDVIKSVAIKPITTPFLRKLTDHQYNCAKHRIEENGFAELSYIDDFQDLYTAGAFNQSVCECDDCDNPANQDIIIRHGFFYATKITPLKID
jgi:hypothetical protein